MNSILKALKCLITDLLSRSMSCGPHTQYKVLKLTRLNLSAEVLIPCDICIRFEYYLCSTE